MDGRVTNIDGSVDLPSLAGGVESTVEASVLIPSRPETRRIPSGFRDPPARAATFNQTLFYYHTKWFTLRKGSGGSRASRALLALGSGGDLGGNFGRKR